VTEPTRRKRTEPHQLTGRIFGNWTVLRQVPAPVGKKGTYWLCRCTCGAEKSVQGSSLVRGTSRGCLPCHARRVGPIGAGAMFKDMTGMQCGDWTVLRRAEGRTDLNGVAYWVFQCACGTMDTRRGTDLRTGRTYRCRSCAANRALEQKRDDDDTA
jgi:hypothetical protein